MKGADIPRIMGEMVIYRELMPWLVEPNQFSMKDRPMAVDVRGSSKARDQWSRSKSEMNVLKLLSILIW